MKHNIEEALKECILLPSQNPPGHVNEVISWLKSWAQDFDANIEVQKVEPFKSNLLISLEFGSGPTLLFNTHMDVNNPEGQSWDSDPFIAKVKNNKIYGLGSCDAKGSLVCMMFAMQKLALNPNALTGKVILTAVMDEEAGGHGSFHLVKQNIKADGAVVGEPTNLNIAVAHKGTYMKKIRLKGVPAHSASPENGVNAIINTAYFILKIQELNKKLSEYKHPFLGSANANVTVINGGTRQNTIPGFCEIIFDRRLIPGETHEKADLELQKMMEELKAEVVNFEIESIETIVSTIPSETDIKEKIVETACYSKKSLSSSNYEPTGFRAGCDMSKLVNYANIPTVIIGPGSLEQAHSPNEFVEIDQLYGAVSLYENIARGFLS
ncbi:M20 family metallopeptidase [Oceanobacillus jeddahense]|uniref:M20 family metallopeptidase n=1 Tax=Oceanobacillus jeddahense TaxID=1462527 RepID=UPI0005961713|nr:M20 family metallopeptidase [Oceanobacillus jeddahense]